MAEDKNAGSTEKKDASKSTSPMDTVKTPKLPTKSEFSLDGKKKSGDGE